ncbi:ABC transporter substrate-binding protein [Leifsonia sp. Root112D2]|jgi:peptide/nickel transport system substrate-binding protein|uniref:ABC transporter substrate-binding protein n=1 Tax=Leifsonia sp. Root112D2 TaxID=1736426 RepID=UPI0006F681D5|nr:ABC transporter substrate-binding protein [Leifsonia sp. Root112D2]KQV07250.1 hypothetical protein ASC63_08045 [Leifsonia sp. Root112D2]
MKSKRYVLAAVVAAAALVLTGCSGGGTSATKSGPPTLTVGMSTAPVSLDPLKAASGSPNRWFEDPAYAALLNTDKDGKLIAGLATKWGYVGTDNKKFELTLRPGLKFADGTPLTAKEVVASFQYFVSTGTGPTRAYFLDMTFTAEGADKVVITSKTPNPMIDRLMTPDYYAADPISPAGIANPKETAAKTFGAGQYVLDSSQTVAGDHYVYTKNKNFYDQSLINYSKITVKVIPNVTQQVQALKTGQIDVMSGDSTVGGTATGANLTEIHHASNWSGLYLLDRDGKVVPALKSVKVRQALNYAVDRAAITKAAYGAYGKATAQPATVGGPENGYDASLDDTYPYDVAKAKSLMADAGYANGFTLPVFYQSFSAADTKMIQAVSSQLGDIGVKLQLKPNANFGDWVNDLVGGKFGATVLGGGGGPQYINTAFGFLPTGVMNSFKVVDPAVVSAYDTLAAASGDQVGSAAKAVTKVLVDNADALPIAQTDAIYMFNTKVSGVQFVGQTGDLTSIIDWSNK